MGYLKIKNLYKKQGDFTLDIEDLEIQKGSIFGILGHSGAGKSTFLNILAGLEKQERGEIILDNNKIGEKTPYQRDISYVFQNSLLFEHLNVKENLEYLLKAKGIKKALFEQKVDRSLCECEALDLKYRDIKTLSGGEKQRVAIACALMFKPKLMILDEPFSNLDTALKIKMRIFLKNMVKKHNLTTLIVSHDKEDAFTLFDQMVLMQNGKAIQIGTPREIYEKPNSIQSANYFGLDNIFNGKIENSIFKSVDFSFQLHNKNSENITVYIPQRAIAFEPKGKIEIKEKTFIDGRWKTVLENNLVLYSIDELFGKFKVSIDEKEIVLLKDIR